jgi:hypothetical protein
MHREGGHADSVEHRDVENRDVVPLHEKVVITMKSGQGGEFAVLVDDAIEYADAVIRPIAPMVAQAGPFCGVSLHDNGTAILLLDMHEIADFARAIALPEDVSEASDTLTKEQDQTSEVISLVQDMQGKSCAIPFAYVRHVDAFAIESLVSLDGDYWHRTASGLLPLSMPAKTDPATCQSILILGDGADQIAFPVQAITQVMQDVAVQRQRTRRAHIGIAMIDELAVPILNIPHLLSALGISPTMQNRAEVP